MCSSREEEYSDILKRKREQLDKLQRMKDVLAERYEHDKEEKYGEHFNLLPFFVTLTECSPYSTTKMLKPLIRAYKRAITRQEKQVRSYEILSQFERDNG